MSGKKKSSTKRRSKENQPPNSKRKPAERPAKLRGWTNEAMIEAMKAVKDGKMGVNRAALEHGVPKTSSKDRLTGRVVHGTSMGPKPYLTDTEENINCSKMGYGKTRDEVFKNSWGYPEKEGKEA